MTVKDSVRALELAARFANIGEDPILALRGQSYSWISLRLGSADRLQLVQNLLKCLGDRLKGVNNLLFLNCSSHHESPVVPAPIGNYDDSGESHKRILMPLPTFRIGMGLRSA